VIDIAAMAIPEFQEDLVSVFGESIGWIIGHMILLSAFALVAITISKRNHVISRSGLNKEILQRAFVFSMLTLFLFFIFFWQFDYSNEDSIVLAFFSGWALWWSINVLG